jgi:hypothetical protein
MIKEWVKIVETNDQLVLFYIARDGHKLTEFCLHQIAMFEDGRPGEIVVGGLKEEELEGIMDKADKETAETFLSLLGELVPPPTETQEDSYQ